MTGKKSVCQLKGITIDGIHAFDTCEFG